MEPTITPKKKLQLIGCTYYGNPFHTAKEWSTQNEIGKLWQQFMTLSTKYQTLLSKICPTPIGYEVHIEPEEYKTTQNYYVFVGMEINEIKEVPLETVIKILPETHYLQFTTKMSNKDEGATIFNEWMPKHGYIQAYPYVIEAYDYRRFKSVDDSESEIDWYIPVKEKQQ
ncbi:MAG: GyrI-like domain-containing protein [Candidatus Bathyarchaeota archaeon]|nr:GyrI-like domain-containing protein [Candidatus Bathyarchaeota archaeon]